MRLFLSSLLLSLSSIAMAAEEHHGPVEIPWKTIGVQTFNLVLLFSVLTYFFRAFVIKHFQDRRTTYLQLIQKADAAKNEAERHRREINDRLVKLDSTAKQSVDQARAEAEDLKNRIVAEAKEMSKKLTEEAQRAIHIELERAKLELRTDLLIAAVEMARQNLKDVVGAPEQKKLQNEFVEKIQVVR